MNVYFYDGSREGFYTTVFEAYSDEDAFLAPNNDFQLSLNDREILVESEETKAERVRQRLYSYDRGSLRDIDRILRSDGRDKEQAALRYIRCICRAKAPVRERYADGAVSEAGAMIRKVGWEIDKLYGLLRFMQTESGVFYAPYEPDCDITELIVWRFIKRFRNERFVIHDVKRSIAAVYNGKECIFTKFENPAVCLSDAEAAMQNLWKEYYRSINISSREHIRQMKGSMPVRYWKYLPEKQ